MQRMGQRLGLGLGLGLSLSDGRQIGARTHVATMRGKTSAALAAELAQQSDVEYAVVDQLRKVLTVTPSDPLFPSGQSSPYPTDGQWYAHTADSTLVSAINAPGAWALSTGSSSITVAVVDTGVRYDHADLAAKLLPGYNFISDAAIAGNSVGRSSDASDLGDYLISTEISTNSSLFSGCSAQAASSWHGTVVAGIIGADTNNGTGIAGMRWAAGLTVTGAPTNPNPARVINLSLGATGTCSQAYLEAVSEITSAGALVVAAAGNESTTTGTPANCTGVVGVAAVRHVGTKAGYSSLGTAVAISAPGGNCVNSTGSCSYGFVSTSNSGTTTPVTDANGGSAYTDANSAEVGTSFSAPLVSGTAALMLSAQPSLTPAQLTALLKSSARTFPTTGGTSGISQCRRTSSTQDECYCTTTTCGAGMLDAAAAVASALGTATPPSASITVSPGSPTAGATVTLSGADSQAGSAGCIASYQWTLTSGGGIVTSLSSATGQTVTATPTGAGTFSVTLTVTDANGSSASTTSSISVVAAEASAVAVSTSTGTTATTTGSSGGGGGSLGWGSLAVLALLAMGQAAGTASLSGARSSSRRGS